MNQANIWDKLIRGNALMYNEFLSPTPTRFNLWTIYYSARLSQNCIPMTYAKFMVCSKSMSSIYGFYPLKQYKLFYILIFFHPLRLYSTILPLHTHSLNIDTRHSEPLNVHPYQDYDWGRIYKLNLLVPHRWGWRNLLRMYLQYW